MNEKKYDKEEILYSNTSQRVKFLHNNHLLFYALIIACLLYLVVTYPNIEQHKYQRIKYPTNSFFILFIHFIIRRNILSIKNKFARIIYCLKLLFKYIVSFSLVTRSIYSASRFSILILINSKRLSRMHDKHINKTMKMKREIYTTIL